MALHYANMKSFLQDFYLIKNHSAACSDLCNPLSIYNIPPNRFEKMFPVRTMITWYAMLNAKKKTIRK